MLPRRFRTEYGCAGGVVPSSNGVAFLVDSADDMASLVLVAQYALERLTWAMRPVLCGLQCSAKLRPLASAVALSIRPGSGCFWLAEFLVLRRLPRAYVTPHLGCGRSPGRVGAVASSFFEVPSNFHRLKTGSLARLQRRDSLHWRCELAELVSEAGLPIAVQAQLASAPEDIIIASLGSMRASTIRKKVREWRKVRNFERCPERGRSNSKA